MDDDMKRHFMSNEKLRSALSKDTPMKWIHIASFIYDHLRVPQRRVYNDLIAFIVYIEANWMSAPRDY